jgi:hypothetical protein
MSRVFAMAGFQLTLHGRFWVIPEAATELVLFVVRGFSRLQNRLHVAKHLMLYQPHVVEK